MSSLLFSLKQLFYPRTCALCDNLLIEQENGLCVICQTELSPFPYSFFDGNPVSQLFKYSVPISGASAFLNFVEGGKTQKLLHAIKYRGQKDLAIHMGMLCAQFAKERNPNYTPEIIVPVPLHFTKQLKRGFNQSELLCLGMLKEWNARIDTHSIARISHTASQTKKSRYSRFENMDGVFSVLKPENIENKHLLVVDDMITTGATVSSLCYEINKHNPKSLVIYSMGFKY